MNSGTSWFPCRLALFCFAAATSLTVHADPLIASDYLVGSWSFDNLATNGHVVSLTGLSNGTYIELEYGPPDAGGHPGLEVGTYTFTPLTSSSGRGVTVDLLDTNGDWGPGNGSRVLTFFESNGLKCFVAPSATACTSTNSPSEITAGWYSGTGVGNISVLVFLDSGVYLQGIDPSVPTFEFGHYDFNPVTGSLVVSGAQRFGGTDRTLSQLGTISASIVGSQLSLAGTDGSLAYSIVPIAAVPEPSPMQLALLGLAAIGMRLRSAAWRRPAPPGNAP